MKPDAFADWAPYEQRQAADFTVRLGSEHDVDRCVELAAVIGADDASAWRDTFTRTLRDGVERALFVAVIATEVVGYGRVVHASSADDTVSSAPQGWYLLGVVVDPRWRRRGIGEALTRVRVEWVAERADDIYYFTHRDNRVSQELHDSFRFVLVPGDWIPPGGTAEDAREQRLYCSDLRAVTPR